MMIRGIFEFSRSLQSVVSASFGRATTPSGRILQAVGKNDSHSQSSPDRKRLRSLAPVLMALGVTALMMMVLFRTVDLKPKFDDTFYFSNQDPDLQAYT